MAVEDDGFRLHAAGNVAAGFDVGRVLHGDEDDVDVLCFLQLVSSSGNGVLIGFMVLPVADGNAQAPADAGDAVFLEDIEADVLVDGMHGQDGVSRDMASSALESASRTPMTATRCKTSRTARRALAPRTGPMP